MFYSQVVKRDSEYPKLTVKMGMTETDRRLKNEGRTFKCLILLR